MKAINCIWEKENIGSNVIEYDIEQSDSFDEQLFRSIDLRFDYIVIKVPTNKVEFNWGLSRLGYTMIETQIKYSLTDINTYLNDRSINRIVTKTLLKKVYSIEDLDYILDSIKPEMFLTDRITLDPIYGPVVGCRRYKNYIKSQLQQDDVDILGIFFKDELIGFHMYRIGNKKCYGMLGGIFSDIKIPGIGLLTGCIPLIYTSEKYDINEFLPEISSNNIPMLKVYNYLKAPIVDLKYVFVKHVSPQQ